MLKLFSGALALVAAGTISLAAVWQTPPPQPAQPTPPPSQPTEIELIIGGLESGAPPRYAVPDFLALSNDRETAEAAKAIGEVLFRDLEFEREFYLIARDTYGSIPRASSIDTVQFDRWRELGADAVVSGAVWRTDKGIAVQMKLYNVRTQQPVLAREYAGSAANPRLYAHTMADDIHQHQRALRGVARTKLTFTSDRDGENLRGPVGDRAIQEIYIADYDGFNQRRVTVGRNLNLSPVWSPDSRALAYTSYRKGFPDILVSFIYQGKLEYPTAGTDRNHNFLPAWSPDGSQLAFVSNRDGNSGDLRRQRGRKQRPSSHEPSIDRRHADLVADRQPARVYVRPLGFAADLHDRRRRGRAEAGHDRVVLRPADLVARAVQRDRVRVTNRSWLRHQDLRHRAGPIRQITSGEGSNESPAFAPTAATWRSHRRATARLTSSRSHAMVKTFVRSHATGTTGTRTGPPDSDEAGCGAPAQRKRMARMTVRLILIVLLAAAAACGGPKTPPVARPAPPPPILDASGRPAQPPSPVVEPTVVPPEPVVEDAGLNAKDLDSLNRDSPLQPAFFAYDSSEIDAAAQQSLNANAQLLKQYTTWVITIEGHADERGTADLRLASAGRSPRGTTCCAAASGPPGRRLATAQERLGAGPAHDSYASEMPVTSRDVTSDGRWPDLRHLVDRAAVRAVLSAPLALPGGRPFGALNLHSSRARDWEVAEIAATMAYAGVVASLISMALEARLRGVLLDKLLDALRSATDHPDPEDG